LRVTLIVNQLRRRLAGNIEKASILAFQIEYSDVFMCNNANPSEQVNTSKQLLWIAVTWRSDSFG